MLAISQRVTLEKQFATNQRCIWVQNVIHNVTRKIFCRAGLFELMLRSLTVMRDELNWSDLPDLEEVSEPNFTYQQAPM